MILNGMMVIDTKPDGTWYEDWEHYGIGINKYLFFDEIFKNGKV